MIRGSCLCGDVVFCIDGPLELQSHCHCSMCRKAHGTAYSTHVSARPDQFAWLQGSKMLTPFESSPGAFREFCRRCGTHLLVHGQTGGGILAIPAGTLDGNPPLTIVGHMFARDRVSWFRIMDDHPQHEGWPPGIGPAEA